MALDGSTSALQAGSGTTGEQPVNPLSPSLPPLRPRALPFELAALEGLVDPRTLHAAAQRAATLGIGGDEVLLAQGVISPDTIAAALGMALGMEVDTLIDGSTKIPPDELIPAARAGALARPGSRGTTLAMRGLKIRRLAEAVRQTPQMTAHLRIATPERIAAFVSRVAATPLAEAAAFGLRRQQPQNSAGTLGFSRHAVLIAALFMAALMLEPLFASGYGLASLEWGIVVVFFALIVLRVAACLHRPLPDRLQRLRESELPVYTIIVPLFREAAVVTKLVAAMQRLDYPPEKLDIKLVVEPDDRGTRRAIGRLNLGHPFDVVVAPSLGPRTKPKALNAALAFARGSMVAIFDAEDEPEPGQLRRAVAAFAADHKLRGAATGTRGMMACVQARLAIDNVADSVITRLFAADYAGHFDVLLPFLADNNVPIPLGGTSNHFNRAALEQIGGWDPYNVTEDADLGIRLARAGYRTGVIASTTFEEAPIRLGAWLRQRSRWYKGWMQTLLVHGRTPRLMLRQLGITNTLTVMLMLGGGLIAALIHPFMLAMGIVQLWHGTHGIDASPLESLGVFASGTVLVCGYMGTAALAMVGLARRRMLDIAWVLPAIPIYWLMLSVAAWRAVLHLILQPFHWEKTEHGLSRTSRTRRTIRVRAVRNTGVARPRPPRAGA